MSDHEPGNWPEADEAIHARFRRVFSRDMTPEEKRMLLMRYPSILPASNGITELEAAMMGYNDGPQLASRVSSESEAATPGSTVLGTKSLIKGAMRFAERILTKINRLDD